MNKSFSLVDSQAVSDLQLYLSRAGRVENGSVRLIAGSGVLAVYTAIFYPHGLLDRSATVLGLRTWALSDDADFDVVVPVRLLVERLSNWKPQPITDDSRADETIVVRLPSAVSTVAWTGISPPRGGWSPMEPVAAPLLEMAARAGIDEVAATIPEGTGEQIVQRVRSEVWGRPVAGVEHVPAGAAFAAFSLGFLKSAERVAAFQAGPWTRLTTSSGHILIRRKSPTLTS